MGNVNTHNSITDRRRGFKLGGNIDVGVDACGILPRWVGQKTGSGNMADIQNLKCKNQRKTSPNRRNFAFEQEIGVGESNGGV